MTEIKIQSDAHWREIRMKHVGGSEVPALFNIQPFHTTHLELWLIKSGRVSGDIDDNERMYWGRMHEDAVGRAVATRKGWKVENPFGYFTCDDTPGMGCTPDRIITKPERTDPGLLQIKVVDRLEYMKWDEGQPPLKYQLQLQHELACAGYKWGALAALVGGNELKVFEYEEHAGTIARLKAAVTAFWQAVRDGVEPAAIAEDYEVLRDLSGGKFGPPVDLTADNELPVLCSQALEASERRKAAEKEERLAKATILQKIGDAVRATCSGFEMKCTFVEKAGHVVKPHSYILLNIKAEKEKAA